jgi:hypothetical protein
MFMQGTLFYHSFKVLGERIMIQSIIATVDYIIEFSERLRKVLGRSIFICIWNVPKPPVRIYSTSTTPFFREVVYNNPIVNMLPWSYHFLLSVSTQNVPMTISLLSLYNFFIFLMSSKSRLISVSEKTYHTLAEMGTLEDSFNSVIEKMIEERQKAASSQQPFQGSDGPRATAPLNQPTKPSQSRRSKRVT